MLGRAVRNVALVAALAVMAPAGVQAQGIYFGGGAAIPISDSGDEADTGFMGVGGVSVDVGSSGFALGAEGMYGSVSGSDGGGDANLYSVMGWLLYAFGEDGSVSPYVFGGAGILGASPDDEDSFSDFGYQAGAGLDVPLGGSVGLFFEGRYMGSTSIDLIGLLGGLTIGLGG